MSGSDVILEGKPGRSDGDALSSIERALRTALDTEVERGGRLRYARTSVSFGTDQGSDDCVTLILDGNSPRVERGGRHAAETRFDFGDRQAALFSRGQLHLQAEMEVGQLSTEGPVRPYLEIDPIIRGLIGHNHRGREARADGTDYSPSMVPRRHDARRPLDPEALSIQTIGVHKAFGSNRILRGVDLAIPEGSISVVMGPSGTGKSVLLSHVIGLLKPDQGDVVVRGRRLSKMSRREILDLRTEIGMMFQDGALFSTLNLYDNVAFPLRQHTDMNESEVREIVMTQLQKVGLAAAVDRRPPELSGGMRKRAGLARAMALDPRIILCDEPDSGLDPVRTALLGDLLVEQHADLGGTMVVITHNIELARRVADHIAVLWRGVVVESGSAEHVLESDNQFIRQFLAGESRGPLGMDA